MKKFIIICTLITITLLLIQPNQVHAKSKAKMKFNSTKDVIETSYLKKEKDNKKTGGEVMALGVCASQDSYEDNNSFDEASKIPLYESSINYSYDYLYATIDKEPWYCLGTLDKDYYMVDVTKKSELVVKLYRIPENTDYDVKIYDEDKNFITGSYYPDNMDEEITIDVDPGQYYIYVYSYDGHDENDEYTLRTRVYRDTSEYTNYNIDNLSSTTKGVIWKSEVSLPEILNNDYIDDHLVPHHTEIIKNKTIIWDQEVMKDVVESLQEYEDQLVSAKNKYDNARAVISVVKDFGSIPGGYKIVVDIVKGGVTVSSIPVYGIAAVILITDYSLKVESELLDDHIDIVQDLQANIEPLYYTQDIAIEISVIYNLNDLHMSSDPYYPSYWYSNYRIESKVFNRNDYSIYEDFKDFTTQSTVDPDYYDSHYFAGTLNFASSTSTLTDNLEEMLDLKKDYDKLNYINDWPFNWLD